MQASVCSVAEHRRRTPLDDAPSCNLIPSPLGTATWFSSAWTTLFAVKPACDAQLVLGVHSAATVTRWFNPLSRTTSAHSAGELFRPSAWSEARRGGIRTAGG